MNKPTPAPHVLHLPIARRGRSLTGAQWFYQNGVPGSTLDRVDWVRVGVGPSEFGIDTQTGQWITPPRLDETLIALGGRTIILNVRGCRPGWNSKGLANGYPDNPGALDRFANLCGWLATRYRPAWLEVWNEPDIPEGGGLNDWFGALALDTPDGGGGRYAAMLNAVYQAVGGKSLILAGSLCGASQGELGPMARFTPGFLAAAPRFDGLSFHHYAHYPLAPAAEVDAFCRAIEYYQALVPGRQVIVSETAYLRPDTYPDTPEFVDFRKQYVCGVRDVIPLSNTPTIWYNGGGWRGSTILGTDAWKEWTR